MIDKVFKLLYDSVQSIEEQLHILLQDRSLVEDIDKTPNEDELILVRLPVRVNLQFQHNNKMLRSIEMMKSFQLEKQEIIILKRYAAKTNYQCQML